MSRIFLRLNGLPAPAAMRSPLLERVLARAATVASVQDWRTDAFRLIAAPTQPLPAVAPAALHAEHGRVAAGSVFIATPVYCEAGMVSVRLPPDGVLTLDAAAAGRVATNFNEDFASAGRRLLAGASGHLYCLLAEPLRATTCDPLDARGRDISAFQPAGADGGRLRRLASEIEMWLHDHALNRARVAAGHPPVTGLWLWGGGEPIQQMAPLAGWTTGRDPLFGAWPAQAKFPTEPRDGVIVITDAPGSAAWNGAESTWLQPALAAVRAGRMRQIDVSIGKNSFIVRRGWSWRRWRRVRPWWEYLG